MHTKATRKRYSASTMQHLLFLLFLTCSMSAVNVEHCKRPKPKPECSGCTKNLEQPLSNCPRGYKCTAPEKFEYIEKDGECMKLEVKCASSIGPTPYGIMLGGEMVMDFDEKDFQSLPKNCDSTGWSVPISGTIDVLVQGIVCLNYNN